MNAHDALTLAISVVCAAVFGILTVMVLLGLRSISKATPVTANEGPEPVRTPPPRRPARRRKDRGESELLPADATVTFAAERSAADIDDVFDALDRDLMGQPRFANARSVRNELDRARLRHAHRLATELDRSWNRDDLMRIEPADVVIRA
jgi:hypothetical protein